MHRRHLTVALPVSAVSAAAAAAIQLGLGNVWLTIAAAALAAGAVSVWARDRVAASPHGAAAGQPATVGPSLGDGGALMEALPMGLLIVAGDGTIRFANRIAVEIFGLPARGGMAVATLRSRRLLDLVDTVLAGGPAATGEFSLPRGGDTRFQAHVLPLARREDGLVVAVEDRTLMRRAEEQHRDFVANASHELKTPLATVSAIIETLLGHARDDPAAIERFLSMLLSQTQRMTRLIEDLLSLNRIELNERLAPDQPQDLAAIAADVVETFRPLAAEAGVDLDLREGSAAPPVRGDRDELEQLLGNLIDNAIKYGGPGTEIRVSLRRDPQAGMIGLAVADTGPGIAREHIPRLTERFYRVSVRRSREAGGTGLGLAIVKHILNRHRGRLEVESRPGAGSRFTAWMPVMEREAERESDVAGSASSTPPTEAESRADEPAPNLPDGEEAPPHQILKPS